ncbi:MAG: PepSY domain-containing protein [Synergistaceae bacterium]|nr:PepSY domain-containing protein [Synergistaceae bacterium]
MIKKLNQFLVFFVPVFIIAVFLCFASESFAKVTQEQAYQIALKHAGVPSNQAILLKQKIDHDFTGNTYELEFLSGQTKYKYEIFVSNGKIKEFKRKRADYDDMQAAQIMQESQANSSQGVNKRITRARAEEIAFKDLGITRKQAKFLRTKLETDDGMTYYEVEFYSGLRKHEYKIDVNTGQIIAYDD